MTDSDHDDPATRTVSLSGPMRLRVEMTQAQLDQIRDGGLVEWLEILEREPLADGEEWDVEVIQ